MLVFAAIMSHPPESIPGIGSAKDFEAIQKTLTAFEELRIALERAHPDTLIVISPHGIMEPYAFSVNAASILKGSFHAFGLDDEQEFRNNVDFANKIAMAETDSELPTHLQESSLDHGALIPLYHLTKNIKPDIVHISFSLMNYERHYLFGEIIQSLIKQGNGGRVAVVASSDLSHKLTPNAPAGYSPQAMEFDRNILHYLGSKDLASILGLHEDIVREAAECGMRSILILLGVLHGMQYDFRLLSYEGPFGVGYLTARLY